MVWISLDTPPFRLTQIRQITRRLQISNDISACGKRFVASVAGLRWLVDGILGTGFHRGFAARISFSKTPGIGIAACANSCPDTKQEQPQIPRLRSPERPPLGMTAEAESAATPNTLFLEKWRAVCG